MPGPTAGSAAPVGRAGTLAQVYRRFGEVDAAETSPLYEGVAVALCESDEALCAIEAALARKRHPTVILAALHDLALAGRARRLPRPMPCGWRRCRWRGDRHAAPDIFATAVGEWRWSGVAMLDSPHELNVEAAAAKVFESIWTTVA
jgi:hypothetical protein